MNDQCDGKPTIILLSVMISINGHNFCRLTNKLHMCVNYLPGVETRQRKRPLRRESNDLISKSTLSPMALVYHNFFKYYYYYFTFSSSDSQLCTSITPSLFHSRLKTYLFHKSYPRSFTSSSQTASTDFCLDRFFWATRFLILFFSYFFVSGPSTRLSWPSRQLLSTR